jgi:hypothetical protein
MATAHRKPDPGDWREIPEWPGYFASRDGAVLGRRNGGRPLTPERDRQGYLCYRVGHPKARRRLQASHAVLLAFVGPRPTGHQAAHLNGNNQDNRLENLAWVTVKENHAHKREHGTALLGARHHRAKLADRDVLAIRARVAAGQETNVKIAADYGVTGALVGMIAARRIWRHV